MNIAAIYIERGEISPKMSLPGEIKVAERCVSKYDETFLYLLLQVSSLVFCSFTDLHLLFPTCSLTITGGCHYKATTLTNHTVLLPYLHFAGIISSAA